MKKVLIGVVVVIVVSGGAWLFIDQNVTPKAEGPLANISDVPGGGEAVSGMPVPPAEGEVSPPVVEKEVFQDREFAVTGKNFSFSLAEMRVKKGDSVRVTFKNEEGMHDWRLDEFGAATKVLQAPAEETVAFIADKSGTFEYYCSVGTHRAMGMVGKFVVEE